MLLSSGTFAVYREESVVFNQLMPRFGDLHRRKNRQKLLDLWFTTKLYTKSGLQPEQIEKRILDECRTAGDFLRILMEEIAHNQGVERWAETTNEHLVLLPFIKAMIPEALCIHMIRDGRDVALSMDKLESMQGYPSMHRYPWSPERSLMVHGLYWKWMVLEGRKAGRQFHSDYMEVRFEDLVTKPHATLTEVGHFIGQDLDYNRMRDADMLLLKVPNTSFKSELSQTSFDPLDRWKRACTPEQLATLEGLIGGLLTELGYPLGTPTERLDKSFEVRKMRFLYPHIFSAQKWVRFNTPLVRLFSKFPANLIDKRDVN
jgi:hypothetical protein